MKFLVKWIHMEEVADSALVSYFHAVRLMRGEGVEEATASLALCYAVKGIALELDAADGYRMTFEKVEG